MKTIYSNLVNKSVTEQQITSMDLYYKVFKDDNNKISKKELYDKNKLSVVEFYIDRGAYHTDILATNSKGSIIIIEVEKVNNNYFKHFCFEYLNGILQNKDLTIVNNEEFCFMIQDIDKETNLSIYNQTVKFYEDSDGYELEFYYHTSGELLYVSVSNLSLGFYEPLRSDELSLMPNFEQWNQYSSYYLNAEPAVPDGIIII